MSKKVYIKGTEIEITEKRANILRATASNDPVVAEKYRKAVCAVLVGAWKAGVLEPDLLGNIYDREVLATGADAKYPFDLYAPGKEERFRALVMPKEGGIPDRVVEGDEIYVPTYKIESSISWSLDYAKAARWNVVARCLEVFTNSFVRKLNDDGWRVLLKAGSQNSVVTDSVATAGVFSKKVLLDMITGIQRLVSGRNSRLTDLYVSPEVLSDIRNFTNTEIDEVSRRALVTNGQDVIPSLYGVRLHPILELGVGQEYQNFLATTLGIVMPNSKLEFVVGIDGMNRDSFVMPVRENMSMFDDPTMHRKAKAGVYGWMEQGFAALDTRRVLLGAI